MNDVPDENKEHWLELLLLITEARMEIVAAQSIVQSIFGGIHITQRSHVWKIQDALATQQLALDAVGFSIVRDLRGSK